MKCKVDECDRQVRYLAAQLCQKHYIRKRRYGTTDTVRVGHARERYVGLGGYVMRYAPDHPLAGGNWYVLEHRVVAYDARGGVIRVCEACGMVPVTWDTCHVDHIDCDRQNNTPTNLRVTCNGCNVMRASKPRGLLLTIQGETKTLMEWARHPKCRVAQNTIRNRLKTGAGHEEAVFGKKVTHRDKATINPPTKFNRGVRVYV